MGINTSKSKYGEVKLLFSLKEAKNQTRMMEYGSIGLSSIIESYKYWKYNVAYAKRINISRPLFEDIFGSLIKDPDNHFDDYSITNNIGNKSCNLYEILCIFTLYCNDTNKSKIEFLFDLFRTEEARDDKISRKEIHTIIDHVIIVINYLFTIKDIDKYNILNTIDKVMGLLYNRIQSERGDNAHRIDENGSSKAELDVIRLTFSELWQLCQDTSIIWEFLNTIESITNILVTGKFQHYEEVKELVADSSKEKKDELDIVDDIDDTDVNAITARILKAGLITGNIDYVALTTVYNRARHALWNYTVKDLVDDNWLTAFPYVTSEDAVFTALESMVCLSKRYFPIFAKEPMATYGDTPLSPSAISKNNLNKVNAYKPKGKYELFCLLDTYSILKSLAQHAPYMFKVNEAEEEQEQKANSDNQDSQMLKMRSYDRSRQWATKGSVQVGSMWQEFGNAVASATIRQLIDAHPSNVDSKTKIVLTENYLYDLIYMIAQGHRSIPVATNKVYPNKVTYVISDDDVASFIFKNANELLGKLMRLPIQKTTLVRRAPTISCNTKLGNTVCWMVNLGIDIAAIIDKKGKICGRFSSDIVHQLWFMWYQQQIHSESITLDGVINSYKENNFKAYDSKDTSIKYSALSKFLAPLNSCDGIINLKYYDEIMNQQIFLEEVEDSDSSSSSYSSDSDTDDDGSKSYASKKKEFEKKNSPETKKSSKKGNAKRTGRSASPSKKKKKTNLIKRSASPKKGKKGRSKSPKKTKSIIESRSRSPGSIITNETDEDQPTRPSDIVSNLKDQSAMPSRPSEVSSGRNFKKRSARLSINNNLKLQLQEQKLQNLEKQKMEAEAKRIKILKSRIALAKERVRWFKEMGIVKMTDSLCHVLEAMTLTKSTKVFVGTVTGELQGMITLQDICRLLIKQENKLKQIQSERAIIQETIH